MKTTVSAKHYKVIVGETDEGVLIDVFDKGGELIQGYFYRNSDVVQKAEDVPSEEDLKAQIEKCAEVI